MDPMYDLFHTIDEPESAEARRVLVERGLLDRFRLRNVHYAEVAAELRARGGRQTPALWDGERLVEGGAAVLAFLRTLE